MRRHGDELGLHAPAGGVLGVIETAGKRDPLRRRQLVEDLGAIFLRHILEDRDRVVGFDVAHAFRHRLRRQLFENFVAHRIVHLGERGEVEVDAEQFDQARAAGRLQRFQQGAEIGFVQVADQAAQRGNVGGIDRLRDLYDEIGADRAIIIAQRRRAVFVIEHAGPPRRTGLFAAFVRPAAAAGQTINA
jgi:hypothetical protein